MFSLEEVFDTYRGYVAPLSVARRSRLGLYSWSRSPIQKLGDWSLFSGTPMHRIPAHLRLLDVNPLLIDFHLQEIWVRTAFNLDIRQRLLDGLYQNLSRQRKLHENTLELTRLIIFNGDPRDGAPKEAAP